MAVFGKKEIWLGIVASQFNSEITLPMLNEAVAEAKRSGARVASVIEVPGAYEMPLAASRLLHRPNIDGVVAIGAVIKGQTQHDEVIMHAVCTELCRLSVKHGKPIGLGISGPGITYAQAKARIKDYAHRAVRSAMHMARQ